MVALRKRLGMVGEMLREIVAKLNDEDLIVVEGRRDIEALRSLGVTTNIKTLGSLKDVDIWELHGKHVVILTDFDEKGEKLYEKLRRELELSGAKVVESKRRAVEVLLALKKTKEVETLKSLAKELRWMK